jgi:hypothetical protein
MARSFASQLLHTWQDFAFSIKYRSHDIAEQMLRVTVNTTHVTQ